MALTAAEAKEAIDSLDVQQGTIARKMGISGTLLSLWLNGKRPAPPARLQEAVSFAKRIHKAIEAVR